MRHFFVKLFLKLANMCSKRTTVEEIDKLRRIDCIKYGHIWGTRVSPSENADNRIFCIRCGKIHNKDKYVGIDSHNVPKKSKLTEIK